MPLDYSKWDNLELSDDSDIECHPNVDKRSMIKWKQESIHRERAERKNNIAQLEQFIPLVKWILSQLEPFPAFLAKGEPKTAISETIKKLELLKMVAQSDNKGIVAIDSPAKPNTAPLTLDKALKDLIETYTPKKETADEDTRKEMTASFKTLVGKASVVLDKSQKELERLQKEETRKMTSENMFHETSNRTILNKGPSSSKPPAKKPAKKEQAIETLNPNAQMKDLSLHDRQEESDDDDEDDVDIELSKEAEAFAKLSGFDASYKHISRYPDIVTEKISDQILAEAFTAQLKGKEDFARNCVVQALTLQYCGQLGRDGINTFFMRMNGPNAQARKMFFDDVNNTYKRIQTRCAEIVAERQNEQVETIQLQTADDGSQITINIPDPKDEELYKIYQALPENFREALKSRSLEKINKVLEGIPIDDAETLVQVCSQYGFLDVGEQIIDETQQQKA